MNEIWKDIEDYEDLYQVSNLGRVKSLYTNKILKPVKHTQGYLNISLCKNRVVSTHKIHRLVAHAFISNPENRPQVNHLDEDKTNNVISNLEWTTAKENITHGTRTERMAKTQSIPIIAINIKTGESTEFYGTSACARQLGLNHSNITATLKGRYKQTGGYTFQYREEEH